ncbi:MAG: hypothetical protein AB7S70_00370 [Hyphomicrobium sp.]|uniref:hypothetical protein n=1 Tax=Hyphomicrobium sp. TaxID=82 RepID=UPI003D108804
MIKPPRLDDVRKSLAILSLSPPEITHARDVNKRANAMLRRAHPDVGGTKEEAQAINNARDFILAWLKTGRPDLGHTGLNAEDLERERQAQAARQAAQERARREAEAARAREEEEARRREEERRAAAERQQRGNQIKSAAAMCGALSFLFLIWNGGLPVGTGPPLQSSAEYSFAELAPSLPALREPSSYDEFILGEHRKWASGRTILECRYGDEEGKVVRFWQQDEAAPYGIAWQRIINAHPFAGIQMGATVCPPDYRSAVALPDGLALEIETWQAPRTVVRNGERVTVERPPALNCLYLRSGGFDWLQYADRAGRRSCPRSYDGPPISGVSVVGG